MMILAPFDSLESIQNNKHEELVFAQFGQQMRKIWLYKLRDLQRDMAASKYTSLCNMPSQHPQRMMNVTAHGRPCVTLGIFYLVEILLISH